MSRYEVVALPTDVRVGPGDDLAALLVAAAASAGVALRDGDVVCVASKVVSKAEGAAAALPAADDVHTARRMLALGEARRIVAETPWVLVVETRQGFVCANAGIDTSNVADGALLLPEDPDGSATRLRTAIRERAGADVGVVVTDTFGRPWRMGQTDVALGAAGVVVLRDDRGTADLEGRELEVTMIAIGDELAGAADLARRKADGAAFVLVRGLAVAGDGTGHDLVRPAEQDVFRHGGPTAIEHAVSRSVEPLGPEVHGAPPRLYVPTPVERAIAACRDAARWSTGWHVTDETASGEDDVRIRFACDGDPGSLLAVGSAVERARLVLEAHGLTTQITDPSAAGVVVSAYEDRDVEDNTEAPTEQATDAGTTPSPADDGTTTDGDTGTPTEGASE